jgi:hypothetical protein
MQKVKGKAKGKAKATCKGKQREKGKQHVRGSKGKKGKGTFCFDLCLGLSGALPMQFLKLVETMSRPTHGARQASYGCSTSLTGLVDRCHGLCVKCLRSWLLAFF